MGYQYQSKLSEYVRSRAEYYWFKSTFMIFYNIKNFNSSKALCTGSDNPVRRTRLASYFNAANITQDLVEIYNPTSIQNNTSIRRR